MLKVSIIVPVYNAELYLEECIVSILQQSLEDFELIMVDDGSKDQSIQIIEKYQKQDKRIKLIKQRNQHAGVARNNGMKIAKGEYLLFLDADDFFRDDMLEQMWKKAKDKDADIVICNANFYDNSTQEISEPSWVLRQEYVPDINEVFTYHDVQQRIFQISLPVPWNKLYRREFVNENKLCFQNTKRSNDEFFANISLLEAERICVLNERLINYRINNDNSLQGMNQGYETSYDFAYALRAIKEYLIEKRIYERVKCSFANKCISSCIAVLRKQKNVYSFCNLYMFMKNNFWVEMDLLDHNREFYYSNYDEIQNILKFSPIEYLFYKNKGKISGQKFVFPYRKVGIKKRIILYAAGEMGRAFYKQILFNTDYSIVAWVDKNYERYSNYHNIEINSPEVIRHLDFDKILVAIEDSKIKKSVIDYLQSLGVDKDKII